MKQLLFKCFSCDRYSMKQKCPLCKGETIAMAPARYSPEDRWGKYRRLLLKDIEGKENG